MNNHPDSNPSALEPHRSAPTFLLFVTLYALTISAQLVSLAWGRLDEQQSFTSIVLPSVLYLSLITIPSIWIGLTLGRKVGLGAPLFTELLSHGFASSRKLLSHTRIAGILGVSLGALLLLIRHVSTPYLPPEIPAYGFRGVIGGLSVSMGAAVGEEVWFRLGLMTFLVWGLTRIVRSEGARTPIIWAIIVLTSVAFGAAHLPQLLAYGAGSPFAIGGTILGNTAVGILYGWCFWKKSLVAAMIAHFSVDIMLHVLPAFAL